MVQEGTAFAYGVRVQFDLFIYHRILSGRRKISKPSSTESPSTWRSSRAPFAVRHSIKKDEPIKEIIMSYRAWRRKYYFCGFVFNFGGHNAIINTLPRVCESSRKCLECDPMCPPTSAGHRRCNDAGSARVQRIQGAISFRPPSGLLALRHAHQRDD